mgnify:FL=1
MKIFKLFIDENIKTWKKFSTKLAIILIILALVAGLGLTKVLQHMDENSDSVIQYASTWKEGVEEDINSYKEQLKEPDLLQSEKNDIQNKIKIAEVRLQNNISVYSVNWKNTVLNSLEENMEEKLLNIVLDNNFEGYINYEKESEKQKLNQKEITQQEYDDNIQILDLRYKYQIGNVGNEEVIRDSKEGYLYKIKNEQKSIRTGIDYQSNRVLTAEQRKEYEDDIKINIYKIENNIVNEDYSTTTNYRMMFESLASSFVITLIAIFAMIVAGGAISSEVSTGTIKFWALTPNKRWKILTAKILSIIFYLVVITLIMSILSIICANIFFVTEGYEYIFVKNGNVEKIGNILFTIEYYFAKLIPVIIFAIFALMLSVITRNTSLSLGLSIATYMGNSIAMIIINSYIKKDWIKIIPFNNLNIADKIFPNFKSMLSTGLENTTTTSVGFSIAVLGVCVILMFVTMYDSFNKRDII